ncbi:MAG: hypothetical protein R3F03_05970 [Opitutaceae bacterium]
MKSERYSALWVLAPLCGVLLTLTGGIRFGGWFAHDFGIRTDSTTFTVAFIFALVVSVVFVGGYPLALKRKLSVRVLRFTVLSILFITLTGFIIFSLFDAVSGQSGSYILAAGLLFIMLFIVALVRKKESIQSPQPTAASRRG